MAWIYLLLASLMEICWMYSLKAISIERLKQLKPIELLSGFDAWIVVFPFLGYIGFGVANIVLFSAAMKQIPAATAFAIWMGTALVGAKLVDIFWFMQPFDSRQALFLLLILIGIVGLKSAS